MHRSRGKFVLAVKKTCTGIPLVSYLSLLLLHVCLSLFCSRSLARSLSPTGRHNLACDVHVSVYTCVCGSACQSGCSPTAGLRAQFWIAAWIRFFRGMTVLIYSRMLHLSPYQHTLTAMSRNNVCVCAGRVSVTKGVTADFVPPLLLLVFLFFCFFFYIFLVKEQNIPP